MLDEQPIQQPQYVHADHYHESRIPNHGSKLPSPADPKRAEYWWKRYLSAPVHPLGWVPRIVAWAAYPKLAIYFYTIAEAAAISLGIRWYFAGAVMLLNLLIAGVLWAIWQKHPDIQNELGFHVLIAVGSLAFTLIGIL